VATSFYGRHKPAVERLLDRFEQEHADVRVVRLRPGLIFKREAASGIRRLFVGPLLPSPLVQPKLLRLVPDLPRLRFQAVHSLDVGDAYRRAIVGEARGPFNLAADPVLDPDRLAKLFGARKVPIGAGTARAVVGLTYRLRLQPTPPGWLDLALGVPLVDASRARDELGWEPRRSAEEALLDLLAGLRDREGLETPPLAPGSVGPLRLRELTSGVGARER
jgi:nucleoside-diphosphate-sugar epimerase